MHLAYPGPYILARISKLLEKWVELVDFNVGRLYLFALRLTRLQPTFIPLNLQTQTLGVRIRDQANDGNWVVWRVCRRQ